MPSFKSITLNILSAASRKKTLVIDSETTALKRCLNLFDLTCLSIGAIIGAGIFVFAGSSIRDLAGPGVIISFLIAGIPAVISAFCFAEFSARVPKAGSTYDYVYVTLGEFWAALTGWQLISIPIFIGAMAARSWAQYFDTLVGGWIQNRTMETVGTFNSPYLSQYPDFFAASLIIFFSVIVGSGAKSSTLFNNIFSVSKLLVIAFVICYGFSFADIKNWTNTDNGGFLPMGFGGVMNAAPTAFFTYNGFESACTAAEEAKNPKRDLVLAILLSFAFSVVIYILMCTVLTLMVPYNQVASVSSFATAFTQRGAKWATYVVAIGALSALTNSLFTPIFHVPRAIYAMASDGLIFQWLAVVNPRTKVPLRAIVIYAILTIAVMLLFNLKALVETLSIAGELQCILVVLSVSILRYRPTNDLQSSNRAGYLKEKYIGTKLGSIFGRFQPGNVVTVVITTVVPVMIALSSAITYAHGSELSRTTFIITMIIISLLTLVLIAQHLIIMLFNPRGDENLWFRVPLVPILPSIGMFVNILMISHITPSTVWKFCVYQLLGWIIYFVYGMHHSVLRQIEDVKGNQEMIDVEDSHKQKQNETAC